MKARITLPDGTAIDIEGTPEEVRRALPLPAPPPVVAPMRDAWPREVRPMPPRMPMPWEMTPWYQPTPFPGITITCETGEPV